MLASRMAVLSLILIFAAQFCADRSLLGQDAAYLVTELTSGDGAQVPSKLNNLGVIVGRQAGKEPPELPSGITHIRTANT